MNRAAAMPYPGIRPFREDEEFLFFGRETQVDAMVDTLARGRFLAVIGSSGCGKSSLVNCGLRPALHRGLFARAGSAWRIASCRPGGRPLHALAAALAAPGALHRDIAPGPFSLAELIEATLAMGRTGLVDAWQQAHQPAGTNLLVIVDQFEELFRYRQLGDTATDADADPATAFVNLLLEARAQDVPIHVVLTMRSDFLGDCARFAGLPEAINAGQYLVPRMSRDDRRAAIAGPARVFGVEIEPTLLTRLVNDVGDDPDQLSLLQHALARTWAHWQASGEPGPIEARHYDAVGTLAHALNQHAEEIFKALPAAGKTCCAAAFRALTDTSTDARGIRRPTRFAALAAITGADPALLADTLDPFRAPGAAFLMPPAGEPLLADTVVDLAHESLMRIWERLHDWGEREADAARMLRRLADAATLHAAGEASLWRDPELQFALNWQARTPPTVAWAHQYGRDLAPALAFLDASRAARDEAAAAEAARTEAQRQAEAERRRNRRVRRFSLAAIVATALVAGLTGTLWLRAEKARTIALSRQFAAQSATELAAGELARALLFATAGLNRDASFEAHDSLLAALAEAPVGWIRTRQDAIASLAVAPDGSLVASGGADGSIKLWRRDGPLVATLDDARTDRILDLAFSPDGRTLASASLDGGVRRWDVATRQPLGSPDTLHQGSVPAIAFSPDGRLLASGGADHRIRLRDAASGAPLGALDGHQDTVTHLAFSPDGRSLASVGYDGALLLWDVATRSVRQRASHSAILSHVAFSPDGRRIATASLDRHLMLWSAASLTLDGEPLSGHDGPVRSAAFSPDGRHLISGGDDHQLLQWDLERREAAPVALAGHNATIRAVAFAPDGRDVFSGGDDGVLTRHAQPRHGPLVSALPGADGPAWALAWSPDGRRLAASDGQGRIVVRDATSGAALTPPLSGHDALVTSLAFSPDGRQLASTGPDGRLNLWSLDTPTAPPRRLVDGGPALRRVAFHPGGQQLAVAGEDGQVRRWSLPGGTPLAGGPGHGAPLTDIAWSLDGTRLATSGRDGHLRLWQGAGFQPAGDFASPAERSIHRIAWRPDGHQLAVATQVDGLALWSPADNHARALDGHGGPALETAFSADGRLVAGAGADGRVRLWDTTTGRPFRAPLLRLAGPPLALAWSPDGSRLAAAGWGEGILIARTTAADWGAVACTLLFFNWVPFAGAPSNQCLLPQAP